MIKVLKEILVFIFLLGLSYLGAALSIGGSASLPQIFSIAVLFYLIKVIFTGASGESEPSEKSSFKNKILLWIFVIVTIAFIIKGIDLLGLA